MLKRTLTLLAIVLGVAISLSSPVSAWQYVVWEGSGQNTITDTRFGKWPLVRFEKGDQAGKICRYILRGTGGSSAVKINRCWRDQVSQVFADAQNISLLKAREIIDGHLAIGSVIAFPPDANITKILAKTARTRLERRVAELEAQNVDLRNTLAALRQAAVAEQDRAVRNEEALRKQFAAQITAFKNAVNAKAPVAKLLKKANKESGGREVGMITSAATIFSIGNLTDIKNAFRHMNNSQIATYGLVLFLMLVILLLVLVIIHTYERRIPRPGEIIKRRINGYVHSLKVAGVKLEGGGMFSAKNIHVRDPDNPEKKNGIRLDCYMDRIAT